MSAWGRDPRAGRWIPKGPRTTGVAVLLALVTTLGVSRHTYGRWTAGQQRDFRRYVRSTLRAALHLHPLYGGHSVLRLFRVALTAGSVVLIGLLPFAIGTDLKRARARRHGRRLKGPELVTARAFRRRLGGDGVTFRQTWWRRAVAIPRALETSHVMLAGDTGTGKSTLIGDILDTVAARGETAVVYDPAMDYVTKFYRPDRGDVILNPVDARCPYWTPGDEVLSDIEALTLATALIPPRDHEGNPFFPESARAVFAFLLTFRPTTQQLVQWLTHGDQLDQIIRGTVHAAILDHAAPAQRSGVMAALNMVADRLQLCPAESDSQGRWSAAAWAAHRTGWVFLTSSPPTRERLVPLHTLWLDSIILRLMGGPRDRKTWLMVDELATLNKLPQLHTAVTEGRKYNLVMVLGFQGRAQLETRYGRDAETILSQPATKIFLHASDATAAKWAADTIGDIETERLTQSRQDGWGRAARTSYGLERHVEPLVMPSEIEGLANRRGYLKVGNLVCRLQFPYVDRPSRQPDLVQRPPVPPRAAPCMASPGPFQFPSRPPEPTPDPPHTMPRME